MYISKKGGDIFYFGIISSCCFCFYFGFAAFAAFCRFFIHIMMIRWRWWRGGGNWLPFHLHYKSSSLLLSSSLPLPLPLRPFATTTTTTTTTTSIIMIIDTKTRVAHTHTQHLGRRHRPLTSSQTCFQSPGPQRAHPSPQGEKEQNSKKQQSSKKQIVLLCISKQNSQRKLPTIKRCIWWNYNTINKGDDKTTPDIRLIEGSLNSKLPTIWRVEKQMRNAVKSEGRRCTRAKVRRKKTHPRQMLEKSRNAVFFQWCVCRVSRKVGLLKRRVQRSVLSREWILRAAVAKSTFTSQNVKNWRCRSTLFKVLMGLGALFEVQMSKN